MKPRKPIYVTVAFKNAEKMAEILIRAKCAFDGGTNGIETVYRVFAPEDDGNEELLRFRKMWRGK